MPVIPHQDLIKLGTEHARLIRNLGVLVDTNLQLAAKETVDEAQNSTEFVSRTGRLVKGFKTKFIKTKNRSLIRVENKEKHAAILDTEGAKPHPIEARNSRFLKFRWNGRDVFRRRVNKHPGVKKTYFVAEASLNAFAKFVNRMSRDARRVADAFNRNKF